MGPETEYALIPLTRGQSTVIDLLDWGMAQQYKWRAQYDPERDRFYATSAGPRKFGRKFVSLHRLLTRCPDGLRVDHADRNGLNNRRRNLRTGTGSQNSANRPKQIDNTSGYKGVSWHKRHGKWYAQIGVRGKKIYLGLHETKESAYAAYCAAAREHFGEFARTA